MKLQQVLKVSLDELRMQMLGVQVLFGFQFQGLFQDNSAALPAAGRMVDAAGLGLMVVALGLMIAVPCQHRMVDGGETTLRIYAAARWYAQLALLPLAGGIGCDVFVATSGQFGPLLAAVFSIAIFVLALLGWYALGIGLRRRWSANPQGVPMQHEKTSLHTKIDQLLTEARVILPGAQALVGFQLVVMLSKAFDRLPPEVKAVHLAALLSLALAIVLLICPAAIHRIAFGGADDPRLHSAGSLLITIALLPLAVAISCDLWVALTILFGEGVAALAGAAAAFALLMALWFLLPLFLRRHVGPAAVPMRH
ncbi:MAG: hypothetical protein JWO04_1272 [Gammaproteobacteria bacterium]|nr:hypothetical protein [Gammaproteobacteria bacterium]